MLVGTMAGKWGPSRSVPYFLLSVAGNRVRVDLPNLWPTRAARWASLVTALPPRPLLAQQAEQHVVLPFAVDAEVFAGVAFLVEAAAGEEVAAGVVVGEAGGLDAVQVQAVEGEADHQAQRLLHVAPAGKALAHPVAEARRLGDAAAHVGEADTAHELAVLALAH